MAKNELAEALRELKGLKDAVMIRNPDPRLMQQAQVVGMYAVALAIQAGIPSHELEDDNG
jgi:hypothetical protein